MRRTQTDCTFAAKIHRLADGLAVSGAPSKESDIATVAERGYRSLVDLRGGGEPIIGMTPAREKEIAGRHGLAYHHLPISVASLGGAAIDRVRLELWAADTPVLIHCGSGRRAWLCALIHLGCQLGWTFEKCVTIGAEHSIDIDEMPAIRDFLRGYITRNSRAYFSAAGGQYRPADSYQI